MTPITNIQDLRLRASERVPQPFFEYLENGFYDELTLQARFKNVQVVPESFLVRAQNKDGQSVVMMIDPNSVASVTMVSGGATGAQQGGSGSGNSSTK